MKKMTYAELKKLFYDHESSLPDTHLRGYIVFTADGFDAGCPLEARTYRISSNNKAFQPGMGGYSIYGSSLDGKEVCIRLDAYMAAEYGGKDGLKVDYCYIEEVI